MKTKSYTVVSDVLDNSELTVTEHEETVSIVYYRPGLSQCLTVKKVDLEAFKNMLNQIKAPEHEPCPF